MNNPYQRERDVAVEAVRQAARICQNVQATITSEVLEKKDRSPVTIADFSRLKTHYPYIALVPQVRFLEFITAEAKRYPHFRLLMGANVQELIEEDGAIGGVRYFDGEGMHEVRALLTVGADGRFSRIRSKRSARPISFKISITAG